MRALSWSSISREPFIRNWSHSGRFDSKKKGVIYAARIRVPADTTHRPSPSIPGRAPPVRVPTRVVRRDRRPQRVRDGSHRRRPRPPGPAVRPQRPPAVRGALSAYRLREPGGRRPLVRGTGTVPGAERHRLPTARPRGRGARPLRRRRRRGDRRRRRAGPYVDRHSQAGVLGIETVAGFGVDAFFRGMAAGVAL